jgi:hypothetical protein
MSRKKEEITGRLLTIEWSNPYTTPPAGAPTVLCQVFTLGKKPPTEFSQFKFSLGGGYSLTSRYVAPPVKQLSQETLANVRKKRLARRIGKKVPLFADFFIQQEVERKPAYYNGITDEALQSKKDEVASLELERYRNYLAHIDEVIIYAEEPEECRIKAERLRAEMLLVLERAKERKAGNQYVENSARL